MQPGCLGCQKISLQSSLWHTLRKALDFFRSTPAIHLQSPNLNCNAHNFWNVRVCVCVFSMWLCVCVCVYVFFCVTVCMCVPIIGPPHTPGGPIHRRSPISNPPPNLCIPPHSQYMVRQNLLNYWMSWPCIVLIKLGPSDWLLWLGAWIHISSKFAENEQSASYWDPDEMEIRWKCSNWICPWSPVQTSQILKTIWVAKLSTTSIYLKAIPPMVNLSWNVSN